MTSWLGLVGSVRPRWGRGTLVMALVALATGCSAKHDGLGPNADAGDATGADGQQGGGDGQGGDGAAGDGVGGDGAAGDGGGVEGPGADAAPGEVGVDADLDAGVDADQDMPPDAATDPVVDGVVDPAVDGMVDAVVDAVVDVVPADAGVAAEVGIEVPPDGISCSAASQSCYSGPGGTAGIGVCHAGVQTCVAGVWGPCTGEVVPSVESCNNLDDNCDGATDELSALGTVTCGVGACQKSVDACGGNPPGSTPGKPTACVPGNPKAEVCGDMIDDDCDGVADNGCACTYVAPSGDDSTGTGSAAAPFKTISFAISKAGAAGLPPFVCVAAAGATCGPGNPSSTAYNEAVTMRNGISVYGGYQYNPAGSVWTRMVGNITLQTDGSATRTGCETVINAQNDVGLLFPHTAVLPTVLDGFTVNGRSNASGATAAITVDGSTGAVINNDIVSGGSGSGGPPGLTTYGIHVDGSKATATPQITSNTILGGRGLTAIGIRSFKSAPVIQDHCAASAGTAFDASGRCTVYACASSCYGATARKFIRGRPYAGNPCSGAGTPSNTESDAIRLDASPGAVVARNALCSGDSAADVAGVRIAGDATGVVVRANEVVASGANAGNANAVGVWATDCAGAAPWLVNNYQITGGSRSLGARGDGVRAVGNCHPRIDSNVLIIGGQESANNDAYGIFCARDPFTGVSSKCTVLDNNDIIGSSGGYPPIAAGIRCEDGGCARIENNTRISARSGDRTYGVMLENTGAFVARNGIDAGCARVTGMGLLSVHSFARVENNVIGGSRWTGSAAASFCGPGSTSAPAVYGVLAVLGAGTQEVQLHSNDIFALGTTTTCTSRALAFDIDTRVPAKYPPPAGPRGVVRNNFLHAGLCATAIDVAELNTAADPRVFENNDLWSAACGGVVGPPCGTIGATAMYVDETATPRTTIGAVNGMSDITVGGNLSVTPGFSALNFAAGAVPPLGMPPAIDVHLGAASMCIDAGSAAGLVPVDDFYGEVRPTGSAPDIGADEHP